MVSDSERYVTKKHPLTGEWGIYDKHTGGWSKRHPDPDPNPGFHSNVGPPVPRSQGSEASSGQAVAGCLVILVLLFALGACVNAAFFAGGGGGVSETCEERKERVNNMPEVDGTTEDDAAYLRELEEVLEDCNPEFFSD